MRDHKEPKRPRTPSREVGVRELKTHAARIVRQVRESGATYVVTHRGHAAAVILPLDADGRAPDTGGASAAWRAFIEAGKRLQPRFRAGSGAVRILSASRR